MEIHKPKLDLGRVINQSYINRHRLDGFRATLEDARRAERLEKCECRLCFYYSGRIGGAMMTAARCGLCDKEMRFGSTNVDVLCQECAKAKKLCRHCGADIDDKSRRKL